MLTTDNYECIGMHASFDPMFQSIRVVLEGLAAPERGVRFMPHMGLFTHIGAWRRGAPEEPEPALSPRMRFSPQVESPGVGRSVS